MATVVLVGAFGQRNPGDEALCRAFCRALAGHDLRVASADPVETSARHGVDAFVSTAAATARAVRDSDAVVVGGGTVFKQLSRSVGRHPLALLRNTAALVAGAHAVGSEVALIGVGADELHGRVARSASSWIARHADLLVLRDEESASALAGAGVPPPFWIGADPVWLDAPPSASAIERHRSLEPRRVVVAISHHAADIRLEHALAAALASLGPDWEVRLQPWQADHGSRDRSLADRLRERVPAAAIDEPPVDLDDAVARLGPHDVLVGMRFHALVAAGIAGVPFVAVAHEPKLAALARRLGQISVPPNAAPEVLAAAVVETARRPGPSREAVGAQVAAARISFDLLTLLLNRGAMAEPELLAALPLSSGDRSW